ncbi:hypothetical protein RFI_22113 [Reticulomyxa filosa]|uniref:Uncharacterized protein n=1 Tax=Reticulomyxa filosa TaxID=46433 RepID=X6MMK9_RETFI|nr:hypothetical protein RFI_22113 [Reticulomyxa filosa]|eukprot:ETO15253.1 hypothetical protein RFI_22113 [Reticulomyxa filosa]
MENCFFREKICKKDKSFTILKVREKQHKRKKILSNNKLQVMDISTEENEKSSEEDPYLLQHNEHLPRPEDLRILFIHGGGWGVNRDLSKQPFAQYLREHYKNFHCEVMTNTSEFEKCVRTQIHAIVAFQPHVIVCKSQGGPTLLQLLHRSIFFFKKKKNIPHLKIYTYNTKKKKNLSLEIWCGPSVLCCPAVVRSIDNFAFSSEAPFLVVSGTKDVAVPVKVVNDLVAHNQELIDKYANVDKIFVDDGHGLNCLLNDDDPVNLGFCISKVWSMYLHMAPQVRRPLDKFSVSQVPIQYVDIDPKSTDLSSQTQTCAGCLLLTVVKKRRSKETTKFHLISFEKEESEKVIVFFFFGTAKKNSFSVF